MRRFAFEDGKQALSEKEGSGRKSKAIVIEPQSSLLRMLLPTIVRRYDVKTFRMIRYQCCVNMADVRGRSLRVRVEYLQMGP